jgi:hypothetical protein
MRPSSLALKVCLDEKAVSSLISIEREMTANTLLIKRWALGNHHAPLWLAILEPRFLKKSSRSLSVAILYFIPSKNGALSDRAATLSGCPSCCHHICYLTAYICRPSPMGATGRRRRFEQ